MAFRCYYKPETITRALAALRAELIREGGPGLEHVEALLQLRGHNLGPVPCKRPMRFRRNRLRLAICAALRDDPLRGWRSSACRTRRSTFGIRWRGVASRPYSSSSA